MLFGISFSPDWELDQGCSPGLSAIESGYRDSVVAVDEATRMLMAARDGRGSDAFAGFVRVTQGEIWRFCRHVAGPSEADDATQETYLAAWRSLESFRNEASARTWLYVIARRCAERASMRRRRFADLAAQADPPACLSIPGAALELDELLGCLDADRRTALVLTQLVGLSYLEAARVCECPVGTIRSRVARARYEVLGLLGARDEQRRGLV